MDQELMISNYTSVAHRASDDSLVMEGFNAGQDLPSGEWIESHTKEVPSSNTMKVVPQIQSRQENQLSIDEVPIVCLTNEILRNDNGKLTEDSSDPSFDLPRWTPWSQRRAVGPAIPIADMRGVDSLNCRKGEKLLRCKLASAYRLLDLFGWSDGLNACISCLTNTKQILLPPLGLLHHEMTASNLVKFDLENSDVIDQCFGGFAFDYDDISLHTSIYQNRDDIQCVMHFTSPLSVAFSTLKCGLLPLSPEAMELGEMVTYSDYFGNNEEEVASLGLVQNQDSQVMFLRNFGLVVCGQSIENTFHIAQKVMVAIDVQFQILSYGLENLHLPPKELQEVVLKATSEPTVKNTGLLKSDRPVEDVEFEALMRLLDAAGYQTGYRYYTVKSKRKLRSQSLVDMVPSVKLNTASLMNRTMAYGQPVSVDHSRSVTPGFSQTEAEPRQAKFRTSKSVVENGQTCRTNSHQFTPLGSDIREYKRKLKEIRKDYLKEGFSSGPQSTILEGVTWAEVKKIQDAGENGRVIAASRGIIQRDHQKSAVFYKEFSGGNPFDMINRTDLDEYVNDIEEKKIAPTVLTQTETLKSCKDESVTQESVKEIQSGRRNLVNGDGVNVTAISADKVALTEQESGRDDHLVCDVKLKAVDVLPLSSPESNEKQSWLESSLSSQNIEEKQTHLLASEPNVVNHGESKGEVLKVEERQEIVTKEVAVSVSKEEKNVHAIPSPEIQETPSKVSSSKPGKLNKSQSVKDDGKIILDAKENAGESVEMRPKEKKKKRGLSGIFSKKKDN